MQIQLYLCPETQSYFSLNSQAIPVDTETPLHCDWKSLWRCQYLVSTDDELEHLFMITNAVSNYTMILVERSDEIMEFIGSFQQNIILHLHEHGMPFPEQEEFCAEVQLISGQPNALIDKMQVIADKALSTLHANAADIDSTEQVINAAASKMMRQRLTVQTTHQPASEMLAFPGCAVG